MIFEQEPDDFNEVVAFWGKNITVLIVNDFLDYVIDSHVDASVAIVSRDFDHIFTYFIGSCCVSGDWRNQNKMGLSRPEWRFFVDSSEIICHHHF